jgi:hypothetical protein
MRPVIAFLTIAFTLPQFSCTSNNTFDELEEAAVYRACVNDFYLQKTFSDSRFEGKPFNLIVVSDKTSGFIVPFSYNKVISELSPKPDKTTMRSFLERNDGEYAESQLNENTLKIVGRYPLNRHIHFGIPHVLITDSEIERIFIKGSGWDEFFTQYPTSRGLVWFSRVGFNNKKDQALLYFTFGYSSGAEEGFLICLISNRVGWKESTRTLVWIS